MPRADIDGSPRRVIGPDHLAVIALSVGRTKILLRFHSLLDAKAITIERVERLAVRHRLKNQGLDFKRKFLEDGG